MKTTVYTLGYAGTSYTILKRAFSNYTCDTECDNANNLYTGSSVITYTLNYFHCWTYEGSNYWSVSSITSSSNDVVCKSMFPLCIHGNHIDNSSSSIWIQ